MAWKGREEDIPCGETDLASLYGSIPLEGHQVSVRSTVKRASCFVQQTARASLSPGQAVKITGGKHVAECGEIVGSKNGFWCVKFASTKTAYIRARCVHKFSDIVAKHTVSMAQKAAQRGLTSNLMPRSFIAPVVVNGNDSESPEQQWITTGSDLVGLRVMRTFHGEHVAGHVTTWLPAGSEEDDVAL